MQKSWLAVCSADLQVGVDRTVSVDLTMSSFNSVVYVRFSCEHSGTELACDDSAAGPSVFLPALPGGARLQGAGHRPYRSR